MANSAMTATAPLPIVRYAFYIFIFTFPIETLDIGLERGLLSVSSLIGYLFVAVTLLQPAVTFGRMPKPFPYFMAYLFVFVFLGILQLPEHLSIVIKRFTMIIQLLALFWISYNLFQYPQVIKGALLALSAGCALLSLLQLGGVAATEVSQGRVTAMSQDANTVGAVLSLGLLSLLGLAYGRNSQDLRISWLAWTGFGSLAIGIVLTGSRGAFLSLAAGLVCLAARPGNFALRLKVGFIVILATCGLTWALYQNDAALHRWERTFSEGNMSSREKIVPLAWGMFIEAPIVGWGPGNNIYELGRRYGKNWLDTHNGYLWILTETGLVGAVPFFVALWLCLRAAWRARHGPEGSLPLVLLTCVLLVNMSVSWHYRKVFWLVLAYSTASELFMSKQLRLAYPSGSIEEVVHLGKV